MSEILPPEVQQQTDEWETRQRYNPEDVEKVEGNLRMTKVRRTIPITQHYYSNHPGSSQSQK
ncbi:hypothetical protein J2Z79_003087 [Symbiobacterium terraclitae]|uniref:Uncharacterized protein n=1 Tax=Symbiobacterium terraclitae TaxID=557451 RepID=A0ABS4JVT0_9FIRM|nr:hypothetical protein [Symbiobacterium terraclitae]MBP2019645.1 hypothetical protein [Symbiobacterium terraclitae]